MIVLQLLHVGESKKKLKLNLEKTSEWVFQWKIHFNPDPNKQANEVIFSRKSKVSFHPLLTVNNNDVKKCPHQKHLGIILDSKLDFNIYVDIKIKKCYRMIGVIQTVRQCSEKRFAYHLQILHQTMSALWRCLIR